MRGDASPAARILFGELCSLFTEPLRSRGPYDFARSGLSRRARDLGMESLLRAHLPQPPPQVLFLQRKLVGSFLLCGHIGARVDCGRIFAEQIRS
jgi:hypothetical protein